ncbi:peptide-methionine (S)-S-oxide reductase MsrA [Patescibacteria group bacterium]|nr:peptide-methionine (S)-S-oxide reductase MsrA [Patescibacteria group bacterium]
MARTEQVGFGGGCFWCTEAVFLELKGVTAVTPGYAGGDLPDPTYEQVSTGTTGHAEVILVEYDPGLISFGQLLDVFFMSHDPTTRNRQGNDIGTQYRSVVFYATEAQHAAVVQRIMMLEKESRYPGPIVTETAPLTAFYPAEEYHKRYYERHADRSYSALVIRPKVEHLREAHPELLRK